MDPDMDTVTAAFSQLSYWHPLMGCNLSEPSATRRLLQIPLLGLEANSVRRKFTKPDSQTEDLDPEIRAYMRDIVKHVDEVVEKDWRIDGMEWTPVLYAYELYRGHAQLATDHGHLVFADNTCTRFLLVRVDGSVKCSNNHCPLDHDYAQLCELQAQQFFALAQVRSTFTSDEHRALPEDFLANIGTDSGLASRPTQGLKPGVVHIIASNFKPCLSPPDLVAIDAFLASTKQRVPGAVEKKAVLGKAGQSGRRYDPRYLPPEVQQAPKRFCPGCRKAFLASELKRCSNCKAVFYCSVACQHQHWKYHRAMCKNGEKATE